MDPKPCPRCGAAIEADHPRGLCPACLLKEGLEPPASKPVARRHCAGCGNRLEEDARFCAQCGTGAPLAAAEGDPVRTALEAKLKGQYRLVRLLGRGGMGAVYLARDLTLDREVAIKVVKTDADTAEVYDRLRREARTAAGLSHPNIVPLHAFGEVEGMPYFVMGYVRGESLAARLRRDGRLPEDEARRVMAEVADALDHAHRQGVVHRDVKPDNVLIDDESGRALLTDFGVAKALGGGETLTAVGSVVGTPSYMSPEQAAGRADIDGRSDMYSLGIVGYAMLAGRLPFEGKTAGDVLAKHLTQEPPPLRGLAPSLSDSTVQAVERCLAKDPSKRWPDGRSLKLALGAGEDAQLPDVLHSAQGVGLPTAAVAILYMLLFSLTRPPLAVVIVMIGVFLFLYVFGLLRVRSQGCSLSQAQRVIWREPSWWPFWYPRALRRLGNVWDRLPSAVRHMRWWFTAGCGLMFVYWLLIISAFALRTRNTVYLGMSVGTLTVLVASFWPILRARALRELRRSGLGPADAHRVMMTASLSRAAFWARPHIAAVLAPAPRPEAGGRADTPHEQLQSILRNGGELSGPLRALGAQAAVAARQLLASIEEADRDAADLARNVEPGEEERLRDKIAALAPSPGRPDDSAPLRALLEKQLELVHALGGRIEEARATRNRRTEMLKTLALHVASLRARSVQAPAEVASLSDRVRALCDDIERQAQPVPSASVGTAAGIDELATLDRTPDRGGRRP